MSADDPVESAAERAFKRRFGGKDKGRNKRDDYALDLFREAAAYLDDTHRVNGILRELGKLYNPVADAPIVGLDTRRRIVECLQAGDRATATALLDECRNRYAPVDTGDAGAEWKISQD
ncbi:MAG TPA: hypothetical protein VHZ49_05900 [Methylomirabilota bacterium]|jgi:hypothetical protein|nr:hypothetical protein [Methylomirabilota bacterium]